jgi:hypothetical protein
MAKPKYDGVVEVVRYKSDGQVDWVRAYLRRGPTFSDYVMLTRQELVEQLKTGKKFMIGKRTQYMASTFQVSKPLRLVTKDGKDILASSEKVMDRDYLEGVPIL